MFRTARGPVAFAALAALVLGLLLTCGPTIRPAPSALRAGPAAGTGASEAGTGVATGADVSPGADASAGADASGAVAVRTVAGPVGIGAVRPSAARTEAGTARSSAARADLRTEAPAVRPSFFVRTTGSVESRTAGSSVESRTTGPVEARAVVGGGTGVPGCDGPGRSGDEGAARPVLPPRAHGFAEALPALAADRTVPAARHPGADTPPVLPGREPPARVAPSPVELSVLRV
ncbi:hypothetical protein ACIRQY_13240 [Streptomyces sp. NPDC101490]|uniref:hypothetical protein n=1 Tax=Streptomyces sp. NPDC101490 TaxID=3366143 RepID=UPI00381A49CF